MTLSLLCRFIMGVAVIVVSGCSTNQVLDSSPDTGPTAQLRVFSLPNNTYLYPGTSCYKLGSAKEILAHSGGKSFGALNALAILGGNKKIGMPETGDMTWSHHEFYVAANQPLTVVVSLDQGGQRSDGRFYHSGCGPIAGYFSPQANHYYDAALIVKHERCYLRMRELVMDTATNTVKPIDMTIKPAQQCQQP